MSIITNVTYTLFVILICSSLSFAQKIIPFNMNYGTVFLRPTSCNNLKVIDIREQKENIGTINKGGRETQIVPEKALDVMLQDYYNIHLRSGIKNGHNQLLLILHVLKIEDNPNLRCYFNGDFFIGSNGKYHFAATVDSLFETILETNPIEINPPAVELGQNVIDGILSRFGSFTVIDSAITYDEAHAITKRKDEKIIYPIYNTQEFKKGIYYTIDQFLQNKPVDTPFLVRDTYRTNAPRSITFNYVNGDGRKGAKIKEESFFAVYTGDQWYLSEESNSVKMTYEYGEFYAPIWFKAIDYTKNNQILYSPVVGGAMGGLLYGIAQKNGVTGLYKARFIPSKKGFAPVKGIILNK